MAARGDRQGKDGQGKVGQGNPTVLLAVLAAAAIVAGVLFWQLNRQTSSPEAAGVYTPAASAPPAKTPGTP